MAWAPLAISNPVVRRRTDGKDLAAWKAQLDPQRKQLDEALSRIEPGKLVAADRDAVASMRKSMTELDADETTAGVQARTCAEAQRRDLDYSSLRAALVSCYVEHGNRLQYDGGTIDRGTALQLLHVVEDSAQPQGDLRRLRAALDGAQWP